MLIGRTLNDRYVIEELIGEGATAAVYRALDTRLRRKVAVKALLPQVSATTLERFRREAYSSAQLNHPGIMAIYDVGQDREVNFIIAELIDGRPLHDLIPSSAEQVSHIARHVCLALDYAHRAGVIHRDIKPANIYLTADDQIKIMDFGLAIPVEGEKKRLTSHGSIIGTPAYLSPEQAQGKSLTPMTDLYSLAVVMFEMLTGLLPFDADDISSILVQHVMKPADPPSKHRPDVPAWLDHIILQALNKEPSARFKSAAAMAQALSDFTGNARVTALGTTAIPDYIANAVPRIRVLMADDHAALRAPLATFLELSGEVEIVAEASDGQEAIDFARQHKPDVVLLDLNMPNVNGLQALPQIKKDNASVKVLVLTGRDETPYVVRALRAGANGYFLKTASESQLLKAVKDVFAGGVVLGQGIAEKLVDGLREEAMIPLTDREHDVLRCIAAGYEENSQIAAKLNLDETTVVRLLTDAIDKIGAKSRSEAALLALRKGWITLDDLRTL